MPKVSLKGVLLVVRLNRLAHLPPAKNVVEILTEKGLECVVAELGGVSSAADAATPWPQFRIVSPLLPLFGPTGPIMLCVYSAIVLGVKFVRFGRPKFLVAHGICEQIVVFILAKLFAIPYMIHVHEIYDFRDLSLVNRLFLSLEPPCLRHAQLLVFPGPQRRNIYANRYGLRQTLIVVPNCPRLRRRSAAAKGHYGSLALKPDEFLMSYVGGVGDANAIVEGVIAISQLPRVHFAIAGWTDEAYLATIMDTAKRFNSADRIHFVGPLKSELKWKLLEASHLTLCIYKPESLRMTCNAMPSNKFFESLAAGTATIAGITSDFRAFLTEHPVGQFVDSFQPGVLRAAIESLVADPKRLIQTGDSGYRLHKDRFNYELQVEPLIAAIEPFFPVLAHGPASARPPT